MPASRRGAGQHFQAAYCLRPRSSSLKPLQNPNSSLKHKKCRHSRVGGNLV
ncbi:MAG: hypothetical protein Q4A85_04225 [Kingella sp. (in: b-proteobacteria)]|nr:hypothetical protein [Kingella sp. (in: b-proteobacteria)]